MFDEKKLWNAQTERFFPRYTPAWNPVVHLLADLGVGTNAVAKALGIASPNVARWRKPYDEGGRPIPDKYRPALYDMLREAVAVGERVLAAYERQERLKPSITREEENPAMIRYNRAAQIDEFRRVLFNAKLELGEL